MASKKSSSSEKSIALLITVILMLAIGYYLKQESFSFKEKLVEKKKELPPPPKKPWKAKTKPFDFSKLTFQNLMRPDSSRHQIVHHFAYSLSYNEQAEQANWVCYKLTEAYVLGEFKRKDRFKKDKLVRTKSAAVADYLKSGYDKGHLAPAADMKWDKKAMEESFFMSNMSPQIDGFNRGIWKKLEGQVRDWALVEKTLFITAGPVLADSLSVIGKNEVAVPEYYYKVIIDVSLPKVKGIGFLFRNERSNQPLANYMVSIDSVEKFTGLDFFYMLPDSIEQQLEGDDDLNDWKFSR